MLRGFENARRKKVITESKKTINVCAPKQTRTGSFLRISNLHYFCYQVTTNFSGGEGRGAGALHYQYSTEPLFIFVDRNIVRAHVTPAHVTAIIKLPVLISVRAVPLAVLVDPLVLEAGADAVALVKRSCSTRRGGVEGGWGTDISYRVCNLSAGKREPNH